MTQTLAEVLVEVQQAGFITQTLAIGRVTDHQALLVLVWTRLETAYLALVDFHPVAKTGTLDVVAARLDQPRVGFVATNPQRRTGKTGLRPRLRFVVQLAPQRRHMAKPGAEAPALTLEVGGDVGGDHRRFHQERTHTTHRVSQRPAVGGNTRPAGTDQYGGGKVFLERRSALLQTVTALVQTVARQVQGQDRFPAVQTQVHAQVRVELVNRRTLAIAGTQLVDNGILDLQGAEMGVVDTRAMAAELHGQRTAGFQMVLPLDFVHTIVQVVGVLHVEALEHQQHAVAQA
ncbi:hypothetical protein D3C77_155510 [compost metagenome]